MTGPDVKQYKNLITALQKGKDAQLPGDLQKRLNTLRHVVSVINAVKPQQMAFHEIMTELVQHLTCNHLEAGLAMSALIEGNLFAVQTTQIYTDRIVRYNYNSRSALAQIPAAVI